jgi:threonine/homoserine/homoserine lactone efflux protein
MWSYLVFGFTYAFAAVVQPGPLLTYLMSETLTRGWRSTLPAVFAPLLSDLPIIVVVLVGLSRVPADMVRLLHLAGAAFLFFLSWRAYLSWRRYDSRGEQNTVSGPRPLFKAMFVNLLNPHPWIGWSLIMGPLFIKGYRETPAHGIALIISFYGTMILGLFGLIMLFAFAQRLGPRISRIMLGLSVLALSCFGLYQLWLGIYAA